MEFLSSRDNPVIKKFRSLAASAKERREQGRVFLEGQRLCCEAAAAGVLAEQLLITKPALERWQVQLAPLLETATYSAVISEQLSEYLTETKSPQGIFAVCVMPVSRPPDFSEKGRYLLLDRLQDPGNMGTIIRCAEAFGINSVFLSQDCADIWSPKVLRSTMGSCFRQQLVNTESLAKTILQMQALDIEIYGAALDNTAVTADKMQCGMGGIGVVIGNEGSGISQEVLDCCNRQVYIPMTKSIESLNAATAAAVLMWELSGRGI